MTMRWLILGSAGMLGKELHAELGKQGEDIVAVDRDEIDIADPNAVDSLVRSAHPAVIVNCAAFTQVDDCETNEELASAVNGTAVEGIASAADGVGALLVQISTDFVFDGSRASEYEVTSPPTPLSAYGRSKLAGEGFAKGAVKHQIVRTSWLFGRQGWNFVEAIRKQINNGREELRVVNDQVGRPTYVPHLVEALLRLARLGVHSSDARGIVHYADSPACSWFDFATAIVEVLDAAGKLPHPVAVHPVTSDEFPRPAKRPGYSALSTARYERLAGVPVHSWREGLEEYFAD